jgi:hypothetical protein
MRKYRIKTALVMKKYLLIGIALIAIIACKKSNGSLSANLIGKWELSRRYGGNILPADTTYKPGNGNILQFNADGSYKQYANGGVIANGTFRVDKNDLYLNNNNYTGQSYYSVISISGGTLTVQPMMPDVGTTQYDKLSN